MPTYDYECDACEHSFEAFQGINDPRLRKCPVCGRLKLRRLIGTGGGLVFKGSGFYKTDYRSESYAKAARNESGEGGKSDGKKSGAKVSDAKSTDAKASSGAGSAATPGKNTAGPPR